MAHYIDKVEKAEFPEVVAVWEASVRATHHFLKEEDILYFKPLILNEYLSAVQLRCIRGHGKQIIGFLGTAERNLEMLFIHPEYRGRGLGKTLLAYSIHELNVYKVDVNEQNHQAVEFYRHSGFTTIGRSELDASGKPYPILHMELKKVRLGQ
ncbi:GNAT family N-acetyltransferase [Arenibacter sp. F20364]|uniref:GNAT family N-acetyltransferase n=1 Tax=Arenibacter sp. F20364 TaxID=2926415 RepID=UPI001FF10503|nr:GNAT family N-acetyltransferase [Arenibacter sp. F20364]MCK0190634.1 GNAT family N-acetyltransferase [Arenibacter sp. F20364]